MQHSPLLSLSADRWFFLLRLYDYKRWIKAPESVRTDLQLYTWLKTKTEEQLAKWINILLRMHIMKYIRPLAEQHPFQHANIVALLDQAQARFPERTIEVNVRITDKFEKRAIRLKERITELQDQIKSGCN